MSKSRAMRGVPAVAIAVLVMASACTATVGESGGGSGTAATASDAKTACIAPRTILSTRSPFQEALLVWSQEPVGSARGNAAIAAACDAALDEDARGTEHAACAFLGLAYASGDGVKRDAKKAFTYLERGAVCGFDLRAHDLAQDRNHAISGTTVGCCGGRGCEPGCEAMCTQAIDRVRTGLEPSLRAACNRGRGVACHALASIEYGQIVPNVGLVQSITPHVGDLPVGRDALLEKACRAGVGADCEWLAFAHYSDDDGGKAHRAYLQRACDAAWGDGCFQLAQLLDKRGERMNAVPYWEKACMLGLVHVCDDLGDILSKGDGVPRDNEHAVKLYAEAWR
jgi:TPR repeat protein